MNTPGIAARATLQGGGDGGQRRSLRPPSKLPAATIHCIDDDHLIPPTELATRLAAADDAYIRRGHVPLEEVAGRRLHEIRATVCASSRALRPRFARRAARATRGTSAVRDAAVRDLR
jgi:hypothetical protein